MTRVEAFTADVAPQAILFGLLLDLATRRPVPAVANLFGDRNQSGRLGHRGFGEGFDRRRAERIDRSLRRIPEVIGVELAIDAEPNLGAAILMCLEVGDNVVHNCRKVVEQGDMGHDAFCPHGETRTTFGGEGGADRDVYHPS